MMSNSYLQQAEVIDTPIKLTMATLLTLKSISIDKILNKQNN